MNTYALIGTTGVIALTAGSASAFTLGPLGYKSEADSPWIGNPTLLIEDFEDGLLNIAGVSKIGGGDVRLPGNHTDSVDGDDGVIDGIGRGHSYWVQPDEIETGVTFLFDESLLGDLPNFAGFVWTDGNENATLIVEFLDEELNVMSTLIEVLGDGVHTADTAADRFLGFETIAGIGGIRLRADIGGLEIDHLQFGFTPVPAPASLALLGLAGVASRRRRRA